MTDAHIDVIPKFSITCNQPDDVVWAQIRENVRRGTPRLTHMRACVVGGGPSLVDNIAALRSRAEAGWHIFSLNASHDWLMREASIIPTHHVMYDSREFMSEMVRNWRSDIRYYISSQCHPYVFDVLSKAPHVTMFHSHNYDQSLKFFAENDPKAIVLGGAPTVGIQALNLLCALGYRAAELYGYDSSWRENRRHAYDQIQNADQKEYTFVFGGKSYVTSAPMADQARRFMEDFDGWCALGLEIAVVGDGLLPDVWRNLIGRIQSDDLGETERAKYEAVWRNGAYRKMSPGSLALDHFIATVKPTLRGAIDRTRILDFGCGTGRATQRFKDMGYDVIAIDFAANALDKEVRVPFCLANLWELPEDLRGDYGYCCDVMEHIPTEKVDAVLSGIARTVKCAYFRISYKPDDYGPMLYGSNLHCTIRPDVWWHDRLEKHWPNVSVVDGSFICRR